jgi:AcrR family transcriptional regulator
LAYEVTKRIKGREYRYRVEGVRDPKTGRTRSHWQYLGRLEGDDVIAPARPGHPRVTRDELIAVTAKLLETRDASRVTVSVIAGDAGVSPGTFYRHFHDRQSALRAAIAHLCDGLLEELPSLDGRIGTRVDERDRLFGWFTAFQRAALRGRAFRWLLANPARSKEIVETGRGSIAEEAQRLLSDYLRRLHASGRATIASPDELAAALLRLHVSIVREMALTNDAADAASRWAEVFPVIERAVFPHGLAAA